MGVPVTPLAAVASLYQASNQQQSDGDFGVPAHFDAQLSAQRDQVSASHQALRSDAGGHTMMLSQVPLFSPEGVQPEGLCQYLGMVGPTQQDPAMPFVGLAQRSGLLQRALKQAAKQDSQTLWCT